MKPIAAVLCLVLGMPAGVAAQALNGNAEWGYSHSAYRSGSDVTEDGAFTQAYTLGYASALWDPRFAIYSGELTFNRNALTFGNDASTSEQTGFNGTASLFSNRPFRLSLHGNRSVGGESANYPESSLMRSGLNLTPGATPELQIGRSEYGASWVVSSPSLPRVEFSYQQGSAQVAAGPLEAVQTQRSVQALVSRDGPHLSNTLRYQHNTADNGLSTAFAQRYDDFGYELVAKANDRTRADVRAGRRTTLSRFEVPIDPSAGGDAYRPPATGDVELYYGSATLTHQPRKWFAADANLGYNSERSSAAGTGALLATTMARVLPLAGLTLRGSTTYGQRRQDIGGARIAALTRAVGAGIDYAVRVRAVRAGGSYEAERAWNRTETSAESRAQSWRGRVDAGVDLFGVAQVSAGYDRDRSVDPLLTLGNQAQDRTHAAARSMLSTRVVVDATYEHALIDRGVLLEIFRMRYTQMMTTTTLQLARERRAGFAAGEFRNSSFGAEEWHRYVGLTYAGRLIGALRLSLTARRERTMSELAHLNQDGYYTMGSLEYRLRLFTFALEHRYTDLAVTSGTRIEPLTFNGNQILLRVSRKFGLAR